MTRIVRISLLVALLVAPALPTASASHADCREDVEASTPEDAVRAEGYVEGCKGVVAETPYAKCDNDYRDLATRGALHLAEDRGCTTGYVVE